MRTWCVIVFSALLATSTGAAQTTDWRFHWQKDQVLFYRVEHATDVSEVVTGSKVETKSKVLLIKRWQVLAVDDKGTATVQMSITAMRNEQTRPDGEVLVFDSREPEKSTPALREQMEKFVNQPLAVLRVDAFGKVLEVTKGPANRYESELPFGLTLPTTSLAPGQGWDRSCTITLDPPLGTGTKYPAMQKFVCTKVAEGLATFTVSTALAKEPDSKVEQLPLVQKQPQGEVVFDVQHGRLHQMRLAIDRQIQGHQGDGSSYHFKSTYTEQYAE
jgi:hypothetical protein